MIDSVEDRIHDLPGIWKFSIPSGRQAPEAVPTVAIHKARAIL
jgi:hypothetical protein